MFAAVITAVVAAVVVSLCQCFVLFKAHGNIINMFLCKCLVYGPGF